MVLHLAKTISVFPIREFVSRDLTADSTKILTKSKKADSVFPIREFVSRDLTADSTKILTKSKKADIIMLAYFSGGIGESAPEDLPKYFITSCFSKILAAMKISGDTSDEVIIDIVEPDLDEATARDTEAVVSQPASTDQAAKDQDEELLLLYLLPTYKLLPASEKQKMLYKCFCIMQNRYRDGTNAASTSSSSINNEKFLHYAEPIQGWYKCCKHVFIFHQ
ncbi:hypothetical protein QE152_g32346 [Popillia japonica]|uniref:Uncharacterized protein n=1 Tax=Popillia japonica TaxID=7064 RepID=A0AAW1IZQ0_POPJA